jgi:hypothetical protein
MHGGWPKGVFGIFKFSIEDGMLMVGFPENMKINVRMWIRVVPL